MKKQDITYSIGNALVKLVGACFWYWNSLEHFLVSCGVPHDLYEAQGPRHNSKYQLMREVIAELRFRQDFEPIHKMIDEFYVMRAPVDNVKDLDAQKARKLLQEFRDLVDTRYPKQEQDNEQIAARKKAAEQKAAKALKRTQTLDELNRKFLDLFQLVGDVTPQRRGRELEQIVSELAKLEGIFQEGPYNSPAEQIDGRIRFDGFDYLLEIKWEKDRTQFNDISVFDGKIERRARSTRGVFISMSGFTEGAVTSIRNTQGRIILIDGREFAGILQGIETLTEVLARKVRALVNHGDPYQRINNNP